MIDRLSNRFEFIKHILFEIEGVFFAIDGYMCRLAVDKVDW